jgi:hypothetical protein
MKGIGHTEWGCGEAGLSDAEEEGEGRGEDVGRMWGHKEDRKPN